MLKPSAAPSQEPFLHDVGDLLGRALDHGLAARARHAHRQLADREVLRLASSIADWERIGSRSVVGADVGERPVERIGRQIDAAENGREDLARHDRMDQRLQILVFLVRLALGAADDGAEPRHDLDLGRGRGRASAHRGLESAIEVFARLDVSVAQKITSANSAATLIMSSEPPACTMHRPALRRARHIERAAHREESCPCGRAYAALSGSKNSPLALSRDEGVVVPAVPQRR